MLKSMTGFGKSTGTFNAKKVTVEIRSLNSKTLDLNVRIPVQFKELDSVIRKTVSKGLGRGKVDLSINIDDIGTANGVSINRPLANLYYNDLKELAHELGTDSPDYMSLLLRMPDIYNNSKDELDDEEKNWLMGLVDEAIDKLNQFRAKEGQDLTAEFKLRVSEIEKGLNEIPNYEEERLTTIRERMKKGLEELKSEYDDNRFEQEMIFYIEKLDIAEEKMRLSNHIYYFLETMQLEQSGKKLGFISQEMGREINTLGSKSNHAEMQKVVICMKDSLEKIKEQILNTL